MAGDRATGVKIAVVGAGSYVFSVGLLHDLVVDHRLQGAELVLMDLNEAVAEAMAGVARRMADEAGVALTVAAIADRAAALAGADFVTSSVAVQINRRWELDRRVLHDHEIREALSECGGVGGLSYTLRSVPLVLDIARDMERLCPDAWLLNVSNPLPRVVTAVTQGTGIRTLGFCNVAQGGERGYGNVARLLGREADELEVVSAGLNHFSWLLSVADRRTGEDLMPTVAAALEAGGWADQPLTVACWRRYGALPLAGDSHTGEFLPFDPQHGREFHAHHGSEAERAARRESLRAVAAGERPWRDLLVGRSWERPADAIQALAMGTPSRLPMLNLPNRGSIAGLPDDAVVEVPARIADGHVEGAAVGALPGAVAELCAPVSRVHAVAAQAAMSGDRALVEEAILIDPAVTDKRAALRAMGELIRAHADVLPQFA